MTSPTPPYEVTRFTRFARNEPGPEKMSERIGTGKWAEPGVPHRGWTCVNIEDLGEPAAICEMCEVMCIRYVHTMEHPDHEPLRVGCVCAGNMEQDLVGARQRETEFRKRQSRRSRWLTSDLALLVSR